MLKRLKQGKKRRRMKNRTEFRNIELLNENIVHRPITWNTLSLAHAHMNENVSNRCKRLLWELLFTNSFDNKMDKIRKKCLPLAWPDWMHKYIWILLNIYIYGVQNVVTLDSFGGEQLLRNHFGMKNECCEYVKAYTCAFQHAHDKQEKIDQKIAEIFGVKIFLSKNLSNFFGGHIVRGLRSS